MFVNAVFGHVVLGWSLNWCTRVLQNQPVLWMLDSGDNIVADDSSPVNVFYSRNTDLYETCFQDDSMTVIRSGVAAVAGVVTFTTQPLVFNEQSDINFLVFQSPIGRTFLTVCAENFEIKTGVPAILTYEVFPKTSQVRVWTECSSDVISCFMRAVYKRQRIRLGLLCTCVPHDIPADDVQIANLSWTSDVVVAIRDAGRNIIPVGMLILRHAADWCSV